MKIKSPFKEPVLVTKPYLPPLKEYTKRLSELWDNQWLTNNGPVLQRFHNKLADYLSIPEENMSLSCNGTLALEIIFQVMGLSGGEVITTPFTFVATAHALKRIGAIPVFADIDPETLCLDPDSAEKMITSRTKAIVPVHVYGHPCDVSAFDALGKKYGLKIIYDAAHAFGVEINGKSIASYGHAGMFSFHSTKLFHSIEGGLLVFNDPGLRQKADQIKNFAILSETECVDVGTNAKMNEMQALMGEMNIEVISELIDKRQAIYNVYSDFFTGTDIKLLGVPAISHGLTIKHNYAYCPVLFKDFETRERVYNELKLYNVFSRRYFYPLLTEFIPYKDSASLGSLSVAKYSADRILTLPTCQTLPLNDVKKIAGLVIKICK